MNYSIKFTKNKTRKGTHSFTFPFTLVSQGGGSSQAFEVYVVVSREVRELWGQRHVRTWGVCPSVGLDYVEPGSEACWRVGLQKLGARQKGLFIKAIPRRVNRCPEPRTKGRPSWQLKVLPVVTY